MRRITWSLWGVVCLMAFGCSQESPTNNVQVLPLTVQAQDHARPEHHGIDESDGQRGTELPEGFGIPQPPGPHAGTVEPQWLPVSASGQLACDLYARIREKHQGNVFFSPLNIQAALALAFEGARGETAAELARALGVDPEDKQAGLHLADRLRSSLESTGPAGILRAANRIWPARGEKLRVEYTDRTAIRYHLEVAPLDFVQETEAARQTINQWTAEQTSGKIQDLIPPGSVDASTRLVLTSALYFYSDWEIPFDKTLTEKAPFHVSADKQVEASMMRMAEAHSFPWAHVDGVQILELPYVGARHSMLLLLPDEATGLAALEQKLTPDQLAKWTKEMKPTLAHVSMPRFTSTVATPLGEILRAAGIVSAFRPDADFSGMTESPGWFLSEAIHKVYLSVDEKGTEAAAATGMMMVGSVALPVTFRADRPFLVLIRDRKTHEVLFMGRLVQPE